MPRQSVELWTWLIQRGGWRWMRAEKAPEFHDPCRSLATEREGGSNGGAKLSPKMLPLGSNNSYIKSV